MKTRAARAHQGSVSLTTVAEDTGVSISTVSRIVNGGHVVPVPGAMAVIDLNTLPLRSYNLDALGLTLWQDGFTGETPSIQVTITYHHLVALPGEVDRLEALLHVPEAVQP